MSQYTFEITVSDGEVSSSYDWPGGEDSTAGPVKLADDALRLDTVIALEQWLKRWEFITQRNTQVTLIVPETFRILGQHLYELILANDVGAALDEACRTMPDRETLGVLITFGRGAEKYATLPWEFLYRPGPNGYFLATETRLVLSRKLPDSEEKEIRVQDKGLRVLFVVALPEDKIEPGQNARADLRGVPDSEWRELANLVGELNLTDDALEFILQARWDETEIKQHLSSKSFDIVHIVGVCRPDTPHPTLLLTQDGTLDWRDAEIVVTALTRDRDVAPQLVVLHLYERSGPPGPDKPFSESFERLAPMLVSKGIPAVLAMQYPMERDNARIFLREFYRVLSEERDIGYAVQNARSQMFGNDPRRRFFGTPVLYMQTPDGRLLSKPVLATTSRSAQSNAVARRTRSTLDEVLDIIEEFAPDDRLDDVVGWARDVSWPDDHLKARNTVRLRWRDDQDPDMKPVYAAISRHFGSRGFR